MLTITYVRSAKAPAKTMGVKVDSNVTGCDDNKPILRAVKTGGSMLCDPTLFGAAIECWGEDAQAMASAKSSFNMGLGTAVIGGVTGGVGGAMMIKKDTTKLVEVGSERQSILEPGDSGGVKALKIIGGIATGAAASLPALIGSANTSVGGKQAWGQCFYGVDREVVAEGNLIDLSW